MRSRRGELRVGDGERDAELRRVVRGHDERAEHRQRTHVAVPRETDVGAHEEQRAERRADAHGAREIALRTREPTLEHSIRIRI